MARVSSDAAARSARRRATLLLGIVFALAGAVPLGLLYVPAGFDWRASAAWPSTRCRIDRITLHRERGARGAAYALEVGYRWRLGDAVHTGTRWNPFVARLPNVFGEAELEALAGAWRAGDVVPCRVDPDHPESAVLDRSVPIGWMISVGLLATLVGGGVGLAIAGARRQRPTAAGDL